MELEEDLNPGDLVHLREWNDETGWVTLRENIFMVVSRVDDVKGEHVRNIIRVVGSGHNIETFAGYFVRVEGTDCQSTS